MSAKQLVEVIFQGKILIEFLRKCLNLNVAWVILFDAILLEIVSTMITIMVQ